MAYTNFTNCTANEYKNILYNQQTDNKIKILFNNVELEDADEYCETFEVQSRVIPHGSKVFTLSNLVSQEATLVLHNIDTTIIQDQVSISIGTLVGENTYEYVPIGIYNLQELPTTDNGKTTIKLRDNSVKLDFMYNAKPIIDEHGGAATKLQILQDICTQAGITCNVSTFIGSSDLIGIYDNTIKGRQYVSWLAESAGAMPIITRSGALDFVYLNNLATQEIPIDIVEKYTNAENFKISRVVYEDATRKYEYGDETKDTLFLDSANPYISSQSQIDSIYPLVNGFNINSFTTGRILGNPAIDAYDLIQITDYDNTVFKTFANNTLRYNGKLLNTFDSEISFEQKKENVSLTKQATFKKWAKSEIDNVNGQIIIQAGQIEEIENDLQNPTTTLSGTSFDIEDALDQPLQDFKMYGDTQQDSTTGKNLLGLNNLSSTTTNQVTYSINNQVLSVLGTSIAGFNVQISTASITLQANQPYTIVTIAEGTSNATGTNISILLGNSSKTNLITCRAVPSETGVNVINRTPTTDESITRVGLYFSRANLTCNMKVKVMVVEGTYTATTVLPYEPFTNGASPNPDYPQEIHNVSGDNTIKVEGKNLFDIGASNADYSGTPSYLTVANNSLSIVIQGSGGTRFYRLQNLVGNNTYTISWVASSGYSRVLVRLRKLDDSGWMTNNDASITGMNYNQYFGGWYANMNNSATGGTFSKTITIPNCLYWQIGFGWDTQTYQGTTQTLSNIMLEKGNVATSYEPYTGQSQLISLGVENLFDISTITTGKTINEGTGNVTTDASNRDTSDFIKVKPNTQYTCSTTMTRYAYYDENKTFKNFYTSGTTITTNSDTQYIRFSYDNSLTNIQFEKGTKKNSYSPYGTTPIELNKIGTYQDYIYKTDKWYLHKEIGKAVLDGSEGNWDSWYNTGNNNIGFYNYLNGRIAKGNSEVQLNGNAYCNKFSEASTRVEIAYGTEEKFKICGGTGSSYLAISLSKDKLSDWSSKANAINSYKSWLASNNPIVYYILATPTNTEITDTTLLEQLDNLMTIPLIKNLTHIIITPNDLTPTLDIEYLRNTSINENFVRQPQLESYYTKVETDAQIEISSNQIQSTVSELQTQVDSNGNAISSVSNQVQNLQTSTSTQINTINQTLENGVSKLTNSLVTIDINGINTSKADETFNTQITNKTFEVRDGTSPLVFVGYKVDEQRTVAQIPELEARQITAGVHRTEIIEEDNELWTADYYVGGES